ncbi:hypothetical protein BS17DRAFT_818520 [Gyrodon lividus]|nr:hypothetical protein BS17DRAFT_818520 [Gyrodon lividus]
MAFANADKGQNFAGTALAKPKSEPPIIVPAPPVIAPTLVLDVDIKDGEIFEDGNNYEGPGGMDVDSLGLLDRLKADKALYNNKPTSCFSLKAFAFQGARPPSPPPPIVGPIIDLNDNEHMQYCHRPKLIPRSPPLTTAISTWPSLKPASPLVPNTDESDSDSKMGNTSELFSWLQVTSPAISSDSKSKGATTSFTAATTSSGSSCKCVQETNSDNSPIKLP